MKYRQRVKVATSSPVDSVHALSRLLRNSGRQGAVEECQSAQRACDSKMLEDKMPVCSQGDAQFLLTVKDTSKHMLQMYPFLENE